MSNKKKSGSALIAVLCAVVAISAVVLAVMGIGKVIRNLTATEETALTVNVAGQDVTINEEIETNAYDAKDFYVDSDGRVKYNGDGVSYGIDVSRHQGKIDWAAVAADGIDFAVMRVGYRGSSEGILNVDDRFVENMTGALDEGIDVGVYFFSQAITEAEALQEAEYVLNLIDGYDLKYPVFFDWEPSEDEAARSYNIDYAQISRFAEVFCERIEKAGYKSGIYFNSIQGYLHYDLSSFDDTCLWLAEYSTTPNFYYNYHMWQYTNKGKVDGINGDVDMNICF